MECFLENVTKVCTGCNKCLSLTLFNKAKGGKLGTKAECKDCTALRWKNHYEVNQDRFLDSARKYRSENPESVKESLSKYYESNKETILAKSSERNKEKYLQYKDDPEYIAKRKQYYRDNQVSIEKKKRLYEASNRAQSNALKAKYRASKRKATPNWLTDEDNAQIVEFYDCCQMFKTYTGLEYQVDHIIPLRSDIVCGLHVPWNLQVLTAFENNTKNNSFNVDEYEHSLCKGTKIWH